ncbi:MAG TPA: hypothetical protein GX720_02375 [Clostridiaceae bacterium]|nr:hypothetical protein [Clostridiaceae bacterium]
MDQIVFVSHCILNTASKVVLYDLSAAGAEEALRLRFVSVALDKGIQLIQLPCPEFTLYGANRWGHVSNQFDTPFFRNHCRRILEPFILQLKEYLQHPERFKILGIVGIDGSPSCGVDYTCYGDWYGSFEERKDLEGTLSTARLGDGMGVFMHELADLLQAEGLADQVPLRSLYADEPHKCMDLLG